MGAAKLRAAAPSQPPPSGHHSPQVRSQALLFIKRMYEKEQLREYVEKFALNYLQLLVHPNPPSVLFGADKDTGVGTCRGPGCGQTPGAELVGRRASPAQPARAACSQSVTSRTS